MANKYIIRNGLKYLNSAKIINQEEMIFVPKWTRTKFNAFPFSSEIEAQLIMEQIDESSIKIEKVARTLFKKGNDPMFQQTRKDFASIIKNNV